MNLKFENISCHESLNFKHIVDTWLIYFETMFIMNAHSNKYLSIYWTYLARYTVNMGLYLLRSWINLYFTQCKQNFHLPLFDMSSSVAFFLCILFPLFILNFFYCLIDHKPRNFLGTFHFEIEDDFHELFNLSQFLEISQIVKEAAKYSTIRMTHLFDQLILNN